MSKKKKRSNKQRKTPEELLVAQAASKARFLAKINGPLITVGELYDPHYVSPDPDGVPWDD